MTLIPRASEEGAMSLAPHWRHRAPDSGSRGGPRGIQQSAHAGRPLDSSWSDRAGCRVRERNCGRRAERARLSRGGRRDRPAAAANIARQHCVDVVEADVETLDFPGAFPGTSFDAVRSLDVLEHLRDSAASLANAVSALAPGGQVFLSIPNVAHGALRLELLSGKFRYRESGLLD